MPHDPTRTPGAGADAALDVALLARRFVEQRHPDVSVNEVQSLFEHLLATAYAGATITQYLPVLLWRQALERWPVRGGLPQAA
jgi:hypothetical protein